jgi:hypothetical protein
MPFLTRAAAATSAGVPSQQPPTVDAATFIVYVSAAGSDSAGNGSQSAPWATIGEALRQMPRRFRSLGGVVVNYTIRVIPPYAGPLGHFSFSDLHLESAPAGGVAATQAVRIVIQNYTASIGGTGDARFTTVAGPYTPASVTTFAGSRKKYIMAALTITSNDQHLGRIARVYQAGVEVARGLIVRSVLSTQELLIACNQTYTAAASDSIHICEPTVVLAGIDGITAGFASIRGVPGLFTVRFETIKTLDAITLEAVLGQINFSQCQMVANGGSGVSGGSTGNVAIQGNVIAGVSLADGTLICGTSVTRNATGFVWQGDMLLSGGSVVCGAVRPGFLSSPASPTVGFSMSGGTTLRGLIDGTSARRGLVALSGGTTGVPILLIHGTSSLIRLHQECTCYHSGVVAVDAAVATGDLVDILDGRLVFNQDSAGTFVPADATTTMAAGIVVTVTANGSARVDATNTLLGAGAVDVKSGANAAITWAALNALIPKRSTDPVALTQIAAA